jgi:hypothetical protein
MSGILKLAILSTIENLDRRMLCRVKLVILDSTFGVFLAALSLKGTESLARQVHFA